MANANATNGYAEAKWIVDPTAGNGTHTTIASALTSASSGDDIFIRPGTYTENLTLKAGVNLVGWTGDSNTPTVVVNGKCTFTGAGTVNISNIQIETNSDFALAVTGSAASIVYLTNCYLNGVNNTIIDFTTSSSSALVNCETCTLNLATTGIAHFTFSSAGTLNLYNCELNNTGGSSTASTASAGSLNIYECFIAAPITTSSTNGLGMYFSEMATANNTCLTIGPATSQTVNACTFIGGTASAISISGSLTLENCVISSTNTNAITGLGTLFYCNLSLQNTSTINVSTQTPISTGPQINCVGINFGNTTLNDYHEGTWTPTLIGSGTAGTTSYVQQTGMYRKIGKIVTVQLYVKGTPGGTATGSLLVGGLPFTVTSTVSTWGPTIWDSAVTFGTGFTYVLGQMNSSSTVANIAQSGSGKNVTNLPVANTQQVVAGEWTYFTDA